ncbi:MAG: beta-galactosidase trimerization domain-containing protein, partial [Gorillibacterium sp.]|nr:beta-galactosidase trimerization domain-containing protein [Gorillibacterium sp.]
HPVIADNIGSGVVNDGDYDRPQDDWNVAENVDEFGISLYPKNLPPGMKDYQRWETLTATRSCTASGRFWISEMQSHHQALFNPASLVYTHEVKWWNWEAITQGAKGIVYWKWFPFIKGVQTFGRGLVNNLGEYTPRALEARSIANILMQHEESFIDYVPERPKAAILYDKLNHDFSKAFTLNYKSYLSTSIYLDSISGLYECLWNHNIPTQFVTPKDVLGGRISDYKVLFITNQLNVSEEMAEALKAFATAGGTIISDGKFGEINDRGYLNSFIPGGSLNKELGIQLIDIDVLDLDISVDWSGYKIESLKGNYEKRLLEINRPDVEVLGTFSNGFPAIARSPIGSGAFITLATFMWHGYHQDKSASVNDFMGFLSTTYDLASHRADNHELKLGVLRGQDGLIICAFNYGDDNIETTIVLKELTAGFCTVIDLYSGEEGKYTSEQGELRLPVRVSAKDVTVWKLTYNRDEESLNE